jgi:4-hydroxymandelate oxidase
LPRHASGSKARPKTKTNLEELLCLAEFEARSERSMSTMARAYACGGAADELTLRANCEDWQRIRLKPRVLVDVSNVDLKTRLLGQTLDMPLLLAPAAFHRLWHREGELATVQGASRTGAGMVLSSYSTWAVEDITRASAHPVWFQLYTHPDRGVTREMVERAQAAGCRALCVTVDTPVLGLRHREARVRFQVPSKFKLPNIPVPPASHVPQRGSAFTGVMHPSLNWDYIEWLRSIVSVPILLKGVLNPDDALRAAEAGIAGVIVSNHGARNLDTLPSTAAALPRIAEKVRGKSLLLLVDGGIRRGTDIVKALAMGASAVLIGRPYLHGLAIAGADGVARVIELLRNELIMAMALTGRTSLSQIDPSVLWEA